MLTGRGFGLTEVNIETKTCETCARNYCSKQYKGGCDLKYWESPAPAIIEDIKRKMEFRSSTIEKVSINE